MNTILKFLESFLHLKQYQLSVLSRWPAFAGTWHKRVMHRRLRNTCSDLKCLPARLVYETFLHSYRMCCFYITVYLRTRIWCFTLSSLATWPPATVTRGISSHSMAPALIVRDFKGSAGVKIKVVPIAHAYTCSFHSIVYIR